jgi:hypothetical protein
MLSAGAFLNVQTIEPTGAETLRLQTTSWLAANNGRAARGMVVDSLKGFAGQVRDEDAAICAVAQKGTREAGTRAPLLGDMEGRIAHFQRTYAGYMEGARL